MLKLNRIFGGEHELNNHDDGFIIRDAKRKIASAIGIDENISSNALRILFGPEDMQMSLLSQEEKNFEHNNKLIRGMTLREYNAFLVNNRDRLVEIFSKISQDRIGEIQENPILVKDWGIPKYQYYKQHKKFKSSSEQDKNVFEHYGNNILIQPNRTYTEIRFEEWCENNANVKWIYKNGDKGEEYFSVVYRRAFRRNNFYPDYIVELNDGKIWIIEAKGGINAEGISNNIDSYARNKFKALKDYGTRHPELEWGFIRAVGAQIYFSNTEWDENILNKNVWKPIEEIVK